MLNNLKNLMNDEHGFVVSAELILISTIAVLGLMVGLVEVRQAVVEELEDVASAIGSLNQGYCMNGLRTSKSNTNGSHFWDDGDLCDSQYDVQGTGATAEGQ